MTADMRNQLVSVAASLQRPAGDDPRFESLDGIRAHQQDFNLRCHETWKPLHTLAIDQLLVMDAVARREKQQPAGPPVRFWADYTRALWRKVNDSIIWALAGMQRHVVKRMCLYRQRGFLADSNAPTALSMLSEVNKEPLSIAIWNDATSCVDLGDITLVTPNTKGRLEFVELKEGVVNEEILKLFEDESLKNLETRHRKFVDRFGEQGRKQLERVVRQAQRNEEMTRLLVEEKGRDPVTGEQVTVVEMKTPPESYDQELGELLTRVVESRQSACEVIDDCLWIHAAHHDSSGPGAARAHFTELLKAKSVHGAEQLSDKKPRSDFGRIAEFGEALFQPLALPPYIRGLPPDLVGELLYGSLMGRVFFYVDWKKFGRLVAGEDGELTWGGKKESGRARALPWESRPLIINNRLLKVQTGEVSTNLSGTALVQMYFDGLRPRTLAKFAVESARWIARSGGSVPSDTE